MLFADDDLISYVRTLSKQDHKTLSQKALKTCEEVGELAKAVLPYDNAFATTHRFADRSKILEEIADTLLCALSIQHDLDISDEDLHKKLWEKARYWHQLQVRGGRGTENLPFEIHVTITDGDVNETARFAEVCAELKVKPLFLAMTVRDSQKVFTDVQTSSFHRGTNRTAYEEVRRIVTGLTEAGFSVIREKIETVPWHPAAPDLDLNAPYTQEELARRQSVHGSFFKSTHPMPPGCYFETHFVVVMDEARIGELAEIETTDTDYIVRFSRNTSKQVEPGKYKGIVTGRGTLPRTSYQSRVSVTRLRLQHAGMEILEEMTEFAVYDTAVQHDDRWIRGEGA